MNTVVTYTALGPNSSHSAILSCHSCKKDTDQMEHTALPEYCMCHVTKRCPSALCWYWLTHLYFLRSVCNARSCSEGRVSVTTWGGERTVLLSDNDWRRSLNMDMAVHPLRALVDHTQRQRALRNPTSRQRAESALADYTHNTTITFEHDSFRFDWLDC